MSLSAWILGGDRRRPRSRRVAPIAIADTVLDDLSASVGRLPAETGAVLGADSRGVIRHVRFDSSAQTSGGTYSPDFERINRLFKDEWGPAGIRLAGFAHSHPRGLTRPSGGDLDYAARILAGIDDLERLYLPIVQAVPMGGVPEIHHFVAMRSPHGADVAVHPVAAAVHRSRHRRRIDWVDDPAFARVCDAVSIPLLSRCRLVVVGAGGSAAWVETMVRSGVGEVVLIDPDTISESNLATQQVYRRDIGRPKVEALADRLTDLNPGAVVVPVQANLDDISDSGFERLARRRWRGRPIPEVTLVCALTDNFWAQARCNRLALNLGLPVIAAQVYQEGRGAEVSFAAPGITAACGRCVLGERYRAWLDRGWSQPGESAGTPLPATDRLNALKGHVALMLLHASAGVAWTRDPAADRWRRLADRVGTRNLALVRLDPEIATTIGVPSFDRAFSGADRSRLAFDETIWIPQEPEHPRSGYPVCGDCGGTGDLRDAIGSFPDTLCGGLAEGSRLCSSENVQPDPREEVTRDPRTGLRRR